MSRKSALELLYKIQNFSKKKLLKPVFLSSSHVNGSTFTPSAAKLILSYNTPREGAGQDSKGMVLFIKQYLKELATKRPYVEFIVKPKSGKPSISLYYSTGESITLETPRKSPEDIKVLIEKYLDMQSLKNCNRFYPRPVKQSVSSTRIEQWNPFNTPQIFRP